MKLKGRIWVSKDILQNGIWDSQDGFEFQRTFLKSGIWNSKVGFESQRTFLKMGYETQRMDLSLKTHFKTWDINLKEWISVANNISKNRIWTSKSGFQSQMTFQKIPSFISNFLKCVLRLKSTLWVSYLIFENVLWGSNPSFEFHIPFFNVFFETQIPSLSFISHFLKCVLRLKSCIWVSYPIF